MTTDLPRLSQKETETAAQACMWKFSRGRRLLIRWLDVFLLPFIRFANFFWSPSGGTSKAIEKILVIEGGQLGDITLLLPFLQNLRLHYPNVKIALLGNPRTFPLLENLQTLDELIPIHIPWIMSFSRWGKYNPLSAVWPQLGRTLAYVRCQRFDAALCARGDLRDNFLLWLTGARRRIGYAFYGGGLFLTDAVPPDLSHPHYSRRWLHLLEYIGRPALEREPRLRLSPAELQFASDYLAERGIVNGATIIGIHPGARIRTRQWGADNFRAAGESLVGRLSAKILWFQDPNEKTPNGLPAGFSPVALPLRQFMAVLAHCNLLICNDSGPMHISTAVEVPVVAIFGPNIPEWFGPLGEKHRIVINPAFWCRPCGDRCIFDQPYCLRTISVEQVVRAAEEIVAARSEVSRAIVNLQH